MSASKISEGFSKYELSILRESIIDSRDYWDGRVEKGDAVSPRFMQTLETLEEKIDTMMETAV